MRMRRAHISVVFAASFALALAALPAAAASAASGSGEITRAEANAAWTLGSIAGSAAWSGCPVEWGEWEPFPPYEWYEFEEGESIGTREDCRLHAFVTVGPGSEPSDCSDVGRKWPESDEQVTLAWSSVETLYSGSATFDESDVPLSGDPEQLVCLSLLETYWEQPECPPEMVCVQYIEIVQNYSVLASAQMSAPPPNPPVNTEAPHISGTPTVGETLTCSDGAWEGAESFSRVWLRDGSPIEGETEPTHAVRSADLGHSLSCEVTATGEGGSESATSNSVAIPVASEPETAASRAGRDSRGDEYGGAPAESPAGEPLALRHRGSRRAGPCGSQARHRKSRHRRRHGRHGRSGRQVGVRHRVCAWVSAAKAFDRKR